MGSSSDDSVIGKTTEGDWVTKRQLEDAAVEVREWLNLKLVSGAYSENLVYQLALSLRRIPLDFGTGSILVDPHVIYDQIGRIERKPAQIVGSTKVATKFRKLPLKGLWHKHWFQAYFLHRNLHEETKRFGGKLLNEQIKTLGLAEDSHGYLTKEDWGALLHSYTMSAFSQRANRKDFRENSDDRGCFTGEWIVFSKTQGRNIYLTLGGHEEEDAVIMDRCGPAVRQFP